MLECAFWGQNQGSYEAAASILKMVRGIEIDSDTVRLVTNEVGKIIHLEDCRRADEAMIAFEKCRIPMNKTRPGVLYIEVDGAALNTRHRNEEGSSWRENKLGIVFSSDDIYWYKKSKTKELAHRIIRREYISYIGGVTEFRKHLLACALRNGYGQYHTTVFLTDGAAWIAGMIKEFFPDAIHILDFFHLSENVYDYAKALFPNDQERMKQWAERICKSLREGKADDVLEELKTLPHPSGCVDLPHYLQFHREHINYPQYIAMGLFIGSGAVESGNKVVLQKRLKQAGMRWEVQTAQYLIALRAKEASGLWDEVISLVRQHYGLSSPV